MANAQPEVNSFRGQRFAKDLTEPIEADPSRTTVNIAFSNNGVTMNSGSSTKPEQLMLDKQEWNRYFCLRQEPTRCDRTEWSTWRIDKAKEAEELRTKLNSDIERDEDGNWPKGKPKPLMKEWMKDWKAYKALMAELESNPLLAVEAKEKELARAVAADAGRLEEKYAEELWAQCELWRKVQEERRAREKEEKAEGEQKQSEAEVAAFRVAEYPRVDGELKELVKRYSRLERENADLKNRLELWEQVSKKATKRSQRLETMVLRRRRARAAEGELGMGSSMVAQRLWELTGRSDWAAMLRSEGVDGLDVMDITLDDVMSFQGVESNDDSEALYGGLVQLRDLLTRPVAELITVLRENNDPVANWYEAQAMLKWAFANGEEYSEPVYQMVNNVADVVRRFKRTGDKDVRTLSVVGALEDVLRP